MSEKVTRATFNIGGDEVKANLAEMVSTKQINGEQSDLIWWLFAYARTKEWNLSKTAAELSVDSSTISRVMRGEYGAKLTNFCERVKRYKTIALERAAYKEVGFTETSVARTVFQACEAALFSQTIVFLYGDSQIGKTTALEEYARRNNHGQTKYIRLPASAGVQLVAKEFAKVCFVSTQSSFEGLRERVLKAIDNKNLIIVDELHQCFTSYQKNSQVKVLEFIREIHDRTKCGMVLCGTHVLREEIEHGKMALLLEQLRRRGTIKISLPNKPKRADLNKIAKTFELPPLEVGSLQDDVVKDMICRSGLGMYVKFLQAASSMASKQKATLTWGHFTKAHDIIANLSN